MLPFLTRQYFYILASLYSITFHISFGLLKLHLLNQLYITIIITYIYESLIIIIVLNRSLLEVIRVLKTIISSKMYTSRTDRCFLKEEDTSIYTFDTRKISRLCTGRMPENEK